MAKFLTTENAYGAIVDIARKADRELVLISPYIKVPENLLERLKYLDDQGVKITLVCRGKEFKDEERNKLRDIDHLELRFLENVHAKCFYNHESMVIASLNLHEYSQQNNREMGILLTKTEDKDIFEEARKEADFIVSSAKIVTAVKKNRVKISNTDINGKHRIRKPSEEKHSKPEVGFFEQLGEALGLSEKKGYCIRGGERKTFNVKYPYCKEHYDEWKKYNNKNPEHTEHYCHRCGKSHRTSYSRPLCPSCLR